ncbi:VirB3 family type IV secretion system protein [Asticcacaulis sp. W401b]|uniref:VirB3 family type IV secretion system protein n=1 Tax=Asticcacaulis sp. W401b TaxID=3388666 RepID=UPI003970CE30
MTFRDPVFRGATRPAMFLGVPMVPAILLTGSAVLLAMLGLFVNAYVSILIVAVYLPLYLWMRTVTRQDDQRLNQLVLRLRLRVRMQGARGFWGALSYSPFSLKKR